MNCAANVLRNRQHHFCDKCGVTVARRCTERPLDLITPTKAATRSHFNLVDLGWIELTILVPSKRRQGQTVHVPEYNFSTHSRCQQTVEMKPNSVILVEGIHIFADSALAELMDIKIFVETSADIRLVRRMRRDMEERGRTAESVMNQYMCTVRPMHMKFVEQSKRMADIIIPHGVNSVALDMIISRLHSFTSTSTSSTNSKG